MKQNEFMRLENTCPKCNNALMLQRINWTDISGDLYYAFCECCRCKGNGANDKETALDNFHKELARKEKLDRQKPKAMLTDIRNYLVAKQQGVEKQGLNPIITVTALTIFDAQILALKEYAEKLGVEL